MIDKVHKTLTFHAWYPGCPMEEDAFGIPKPKDTELIVPTLLFVPCVGYGPGGYRLGYGGGFYDRTLAALERALGEAVAKINAAFKAAMADPAVRQRIADQGLEIPPAEQQSPEAFAAYLKSEMDKWGAVIRESGIKGQ